MKIHKNNILILIAIVAIFLIGLFFGISLNGNFFPKSCEYKGNTYKSGQGFTDECNSCSCDDGNVACTAIACQ